MGNFPGKFFVSLLALVIALTPLWFGLIAQHFISSVWFAQHLLVSVVGLCLLSLTQAFLFFLWLIGFYLVWIYGPKE